jgi:uncharacterized protein YciI
MRWTSTLLSMFFVASVTYAQAIAAPEGSARYYVVFLRPDPARTPLSKADGERIMTAHMANIRKMADDGIMVSAGPFDDTPTTIEGVFVFKTDSLSSAQAVAAQDPTVLEHRNTVDVHAWEGPPGIGAEYFWLHQRDPKTPDNMQMHPFCMLYRGDEWEAQSHNREVLLAAHERYIEQLREQGKLSAAGKVAPPDALLDLVVFRPIPLEDAQRLLGDDPAIRAGVIRAEYHHWWSADHVLPW